MLPESPSWPAQHCSTDWSKLAICLYTCVIIWSDRPPFTGRNASLYRRLWVLSCNPPVSRGCHAARRGRHFPIIISTLVLPIYKAPTKRGNPYWGLKFAQVTAKYVITVVCSDLNAIEAGACDCVEMRVHVYCGWLLKHMWTSGSFCYVNLKTKCRNTVSMFFKLIFRFRKPR